MLLLGGKQGISLIKRTTWEMSRRSGVESLVLAAGTGMISHSLQAGKCRSFNYKNNSTLLPYENESEKKKLHKNSWRK